VWLAQTRTPYDRHECEHRIWRKQVLAFAFDEGLGHEGHVLNSEFMQVFASLVKRDEP